MPVLKSTPPVGCSVAFTSGLPGFLSAGAGTQFVGHGVSIPSLADLSAAREAQQVFALSLTDAANNTGAISPAPAGWRIFAGNMPGKCVVGRMVQTSPSGTWKMIAVYYGSPALNALNATMDLAAPLIPVDQEYQLRVLEVHGLNLHAFWLVAQKAGAVDLIIPFPAAPHQLIDGLNGSNKYTMPAFLTVIRPLAVNKLNMAPGQGA
jgi:hypothetical protein